jgi:hypothetical protein
MTKCGSESLPGKLEFAKTRLGQEGAAMKIIGCDFHPSYQQIAMVDVGTGELWEGRLEHEQREARHFYQALRGQTVRVGMKAVGNSQWFKQMFGGDAAPVVHRRCGADLVASGAAAEDR